VSESEVEALLCFSWFPKKSSKKPKIDWKLGFPVSKLFFGVAEASGLFKWSLVASSADIFWGDQQALVYTPRGTQ